MEVKIQQAENGWIFLRKGHPPKIFVRWDYLLAHLTEILTVQHEK